MSSVNDVRALSLGVLMELIDEAGAALKPHTIKMIMVLLEALSGLESPVLNYFSARLTDDNVQVCIQEQCFHGICAELRLSRGDLC